MEGSLVNRIIPPRRAATQATASYSELTEGSGDEDSPRLQDKIRHSNRGKGRILVKPRSSVTHTPSRATVSEFLPSTSTPSSTNTPRPAPRPLPKKTKQQITPPAKPLSYIRGSDSDLTPVSSPVCSPALNPKLLELPETPQRIQSQKRRALSTSNPSTLYLRRPSTTESWDISKLGTYVWVLLDTSARVLEPADITDSSEQTKEWLWWPGKIKSPLTSTPLKVHLFGDAYPGLKNTEIHSPCHMNILSLENSMQRARFDFPTFVTGASFFEDLQGSPRKKQKHDRGNQEDRWGAAVAELLQEKEDDQGSDAMPEVGTLGFVAYVSSAPLSPAKGTPRAKGMGKGNAKRVSDPADDFDVEISDFKCDEDRWSPPPADDSLEIPGELLFARDRQSSAIYWPAKILKYVPPKKRTQEPKYSLEFLDNTVLEIPRKLFFTSEDDGFTTCKVGKWESAICDVLNDDEDDEEDIAIDAPRSTSPVPSDPPPPSAQFIHLHIREQFVYVKNILKALLDGEYTPVKRQHDLFIGGGLGRKSVCDEAGLRGRMDPRDVAQLQTHLIEWCLRDEKRAKPIVDENDPAEPEGWSPTYDLTGNGFEEDLPLSNVRGGSPSLPSTDGASTFPSQPMHSDSFCRYPSEEVELPPMSSQFSEDSPTISLSKLPQETKVNDDSHPSPMQLVSEENTALPRQRGCEGYEALAKVEKIDYCVNVLLPEAILQILLWRGGHRTSVDLMSDEEERELHEKGEELRKERDWVYDVMRLRKLKLKQMQGMSQASSRPNGETNSRTRRETASGRPKRNVAMPKSYLE